MSAFAAGHATHPDWRMALALAAAQVDAQRPRPPQPPWRLGLVYFTDAYAPHAKPLLAELQQRWPGVAWAGCVGVGVAATGVEYIDEPALVLLLCGLPPQAFEVFSGARPLSRIKPFTALVHADSGTPDIGELIVEMSERTHSGYLFGGLAASRAGVLTVADGVWQGGLSGVAFAADLPLVSRVTQGCQPVGPTRTITACQDHVVLALDGEPALPLLLRDLGLREGELGRDHRGALPRLRATLAGLVDADDAALDRGGRFGADVRVRHLVGLDPGRRAVALAERVQPGMQLAFCGRDVQAARRDLVRICSEIRDELDGRPMRGAVYVSCAVRGGPHFGAPSAELQIVQHALGEVPLAGFFAGGEIAHRHLYGYTGVLTVFAADH
ncbi:MAG: FIST C-terminal domain-containing protein [Proteobacteria bacterium]|nr:FIST C-terminal domain-containing protein [Pseudomonadota bacterium]